MGCTNCGSKVWGVCKCCENIAILKHGSYEPKMKRVKFCEDCGQYICDECDNKYIKRGVAAVIQLFRK